MPFDPLWALLTPLCDAVSPLHPFECITCPDRQNRPIHLFLNEGTHVNGTTALHVTFQTSPSAFKVETHPQEIWLFYREQSEDLSRMPPPWIYKTAEDLVAAADEREKIVQRRAELNIEGTMISVCSFIYTLVLFSELSSHSVTANKAEDAAEQDGLGLILGDGPMTQPADGPSVYRQNSVQDNSVRDEEGRPKIIIVSVSYASNCLIWVNESTASLQKVYSYMSLQKQCPNPQIALWTVFIGTNVLERK